MACGPGAPDLMADHPAAKGLAALRRGDAAQALREFERLLEAEPNGVPGHFLRVEALLALGDRARARESLLGLVSRFPFAEGACRERLAILALQDGDADTAVSELTRATAAGWSNADAVRGAEAFAPFASDARFAPLFAAAARNE
ncbi:MAG TPA: tetratricopeptide repeat protein [bacterium]|nr:tetratricopeptide repeat protein [bacterium]